MENANTELSPKKKAENRIKKIPWRSIIVAVVLVYAVFVFVGQQKKINAENIRNVELTDELNELDSEKEYLEHKKSFIGTDSYAEQSVRERLNWVGEDEIIFYSDNSLPESSSPSE